MTLNNKNKVVTTSKNDTEVYSSRLKLSGKLISQFYGQKHPTAFSPLGGASVPTQEKKVLGSQEIRKDQENLKTYNYKF